MVNSIVNLEIVYEGLLRAGMKVELVPAPVMPGVRELKFLLPGDNAEEAEKILYACVKGQSGTLPKKGNLLLFGEWETEELPECGYVLCHDADPFAVVNVVESVFSRYTALQNRLYNALSEENSLQRICELAQLEFGVPVFYHDEHFCVLACAMSEEEKCRSFDYNPQLDCYMQDEETLRYFRTSEAYQETLNTRGAQIWVSDFDNGSSLYVNLFLENIYRGRMLYRQQNITPGQGRVVEYIAAMACQALYRSYSYSVSANTPFLQLIADGVDGVEIEEERFLLQTRLLNWGMEDRYVCCMIAPGGDDQFMILSVCNSVLQHIRGSYPCYYNNAIYILVNLSVADMTVTDLRMKMSYLIRESLVKAGVSNEFRDFSQFPVYLRQAEITLLYAQEKGLMSWYNEFRDTALPYWLQKGVGALTAESIVSEGVNVLKKYDADNGSDLYETLKVYLISERNATLTGQLLRVHRSTLPHRLERIRSLTGLNLDDFPTRLYLLMSFALEDSDITK